MYTYKVHCQCINIYDKFLLTCGKKGEKQRTFLNHHEF